MHFKFNALVLCAIGIWCGPSSALTQDRGAEEPLRQAKQQLSQGEPRTAAITLLNAAQQHPDSAAIRQLLATTSLELGDGERAEKEINKAMELGLDPAVGWPVLVKALFAQADMRRVIDTASRMPPDTAVADRADILGMRGYAEASERQWAKAEQTLKSALSISADSLPAIAGMAVLHGRRTEYEQARQWVDRALDLYPDAPESWILLGDLLLALGEYQQAEAAIAKAIARRHYTGLERARRALALTQLERYDEAAEDLAALADAGLSDHPYARYVTGRLYFAQQLYQPAAEAFDAAYAADSRFLVNRLYLAVSRILLGQPEQALIHAQFFASRTADALAPTRTDGAILSVRPVRVAEADASQYPVAQNALMTAFDKKPDDTTILRLLSSLALLDGSAEQAADYAQRLAELEPLAPEAQGMAEIAIPRVKVADPVDHYTRDLLGVLAALQDGALNDALTQAQQLAARYPHKADPLNLVAAAQLMSGQWEQGRLALQDSLAVDPEQPDVMMNLAQIALRADDPARARDLLNRLEPEQLGPKGTLLLYQAETRLGEHETGLQLLRTALDAHPEATEIRKELAAVALRSGDTVRVLELTDGLGTTQFEAIPELYELRGRAQLMAGDAAAARQTFEQWTRAQPEASAAQFYLAEALVKSGQADAADAAVDRAVELDRANVTARIGQVKSLVRRGEVAEAKEAVAALKDDFGDQAGVLGIEGWFYLGIGDWQTARTSLSRSLELKSDSEVTQLLVRALWAQQAHEEAIDVMNRRLEQAPSDLPVLMLLAGSYLTLERDADARDVYARVVEAYPNHIPALNNLAWLSRDDDLEAALGYARAANELLPEDAYVLDTLGKLLILQGDTAEGIDRLRKAAEKLPDDAEVQLHLGRALLEHDQPSEAREVLDRLLERAPESAQAEQAKTLLARLAAKSPP